MKRRTHARSAEKTAQPKSRETVREPARGVPLDDVKRALLDALKTLKPATPSLRLQVQELLPLLFSVDGHVEIPLRAGTWSAGGMAIHIEEGCVASAHLSLKAGMPDETSHVTFTPAIRVGDAMRVEALRIQLRDDGKMELALVLDGGLQIPERSETSAPPMHLGVVEIARAHGKATVRLREKKVLLGDVAITPSERGELRIALKDGVVSVEGDAVLAAVALCDGRSSVELTHLSCIPDMRVHLGSPLRVDGDVRSIDASIASVFLGARDAPTTLELSGGKLHSDVLHISGESVTGSLHAEGKGAHLKAAISVDNQQSSLDVKAGRVTADVQLSRKASVVHATLAQATGVVTGLSAHKGTASFSVPRLELTGDGTLDLDTSRPGIELTIKARTVVGEVGGVDVKTERAVIRAGRTTAAGSAELAITRDGSRIEGDVRLQGALDDVRVRDEKGNAVITVKEGASIDGHLCALRFGGGRKVHVQAAADVKADLKDHVIDVPALHAEGDAHLQGHFVIRLDEGTLNVTSEDAALTSVVRQAVVSLGEQGTITADEGSRVHLPLREARINSRDDERRIVIADGARLELQVSEGEVTAADRTFHVAPQSRADVALRALIIEGGNAETIRGSVQMEVAVVEKKDEDGMPRGEEAAGLEARAVVHLEEVALHPDGRLQAQGVKLGMNAQVQPEKSRLDDVEKGHRRPATTHAEENVTKGAVEGDPSDQDPLRFLEYLCNGTIDADLPVEGVVGEGMLQTVTFSPGTRLVLHAEVRDGCILPSTFKGRFTHSGDAPLWITARGFYLDDDGTLRLDLGGMLDLAAPGVDKMPLDLQGFVRAAVFGDVQIPGLREAVDLDDIRFSLKDASFKAGRIPLGDSWVEVTDRSRVSIEGTRTQVSMIGVLDISGIHVVHKRGVLTGGKGSADVQMGYENQGGTGVIRLLLSHLFLSAESVTTDGVPFAGAGHVHDATLSMTGAVTLDEDGIPIDVVPSDVELRAERIDARREKA